MGVQRVFIGATILKFLTYPLKPQMWHWRHDFFIFKILNFNDFFIFLGEMPQFCKKDTFFIDKNKMNCYVFW